MKKRIVPFHKLLSVSISLVLVLLLYPILLTGQDTRTFEFTNRTDAVKDDIHIVFNTDAAAKDITLKDDYDHAAAAAPREGDYGITIGDFQVSPGGKIRFTFEVPAGAEFEFVQYSWSENSKRDDEPADPETADEVCLTPAGEYSPVGEALAYKPIGQGRTTDHVVDLVITNPTSCATTVTIPACIVPATGRQQGYLIPDEYVVTIPGNTTGTVALRGFCTDIHRPPVAAGTETTPFEEWIFRPEAGPVPAPGEMMTASEGFVALNAGQIGAGSFTVTYPDSETPFPYTIDLNRYPEASAPLLFDAFTSIAEAYDSLSAADAISTPFQHDPAKERTSVLQQSFWTYTAALTGAEYKIGDFSERVVAEYESASGQDFDEAPEETRESVHLGAVDFWNTFTAVGESAKVYRNNDGEYVVCYAKKNCVGRIGPGVTKEWCKSEGYKSYRPGQFKPCVNF